MSQEERTPVLPSASTDIVAGPATPRPEAPGPPVIRAPLDVRSLALSAIGGAGGGAGAAERSVRHVEDLRPIGELLGE